MKNIKSLFFSVLVLIFCPEAKCQTNLPKLQNFNVGIIIPLSGDLAEYGSAIRNGFELARKDAPENFSNVNFVYEDSRYDGKTAVDALQKLKSSDSIDLYYLWGVSPTEAMLPIAVAQKLPVIAETTVKEATVGKPFVIRAARTGERIAKALTAELENRKVKSVSLIVTQIPFYMDIIKHLESSLKDKGIAVKKKAEVLPSEIDFKSFLLDRDLQGAQILGAFLLPAQFIAFYRQAEQLHLKIPTFSADIIDSETLVKDCSDKIDGMFYTQVGVIPEFRQNYKKSFGNDNQIGSAAQAYDMGMLVSELFGKLERNLTNEEVIDRISKIAPHKGATGSFSYSDSSDGGKEIRMPVSMKVVRGKALEIIAEDTGY